MTMTHAPLPWVFREQGDANEFCLLTAEGKWVIAFLQNGELMVERQREIAAFIVRACNAHDDLLAALKTVTELLEGFRENPIDADLDEDEEPIIAPAIDQARAALAKAETR